MLLMVISITALRSSIVPVNVGVLSLVINWLIVTVGAVVSMLNWSGPV